MVEQRSEIRNTHKRRLGEVVSRSGDKSVVVLVKRRVRHPQYGKVVTRSKKYHVHDEKNAAMVGDRVKIVECRPISRLKRWRLKDVLFTRPRELGAAAE